MISLFLCGAQSAVAQGTLFVEGGNEGVGIEVPEATLHVNKLNGTAQLKVEEESSTTSARTLFTLAKNGAFGSLFIPARVSNFVIDFNKNAGNELRLLQTGDLEIGGFL